MKKYFIAMMAAMLLSMPTMAQKGKAKSLEVSFNYQKQAGPGSNQYAVWIENEKGEVVKTLFVTSFTTKGRVRGNEQPMRGYVKRPNCVPTWVKTVKANDQVSRDGGSHVLSGQRHHLLRHVLHEGQSRKRNPHL